MIEHAVRHQFEIDEINQQEQFVTVTLLSTELMRNFTNALYSFVKRNSDELDRFGPLRPVQLVTLLAGRLWLARQMIIGTKEVQSNTTYATKFVLANGEEIIREDETIIDRQFEVDVVNLAEQSVTFTIYQKPIPGRPNFLSTVIDCLGQFDASVNSTIEHEIDTRHLTASATMSNGNLMINIKSNEIATNLFADLDLLTVLRSHLWLAAEMLRGRLNPLVALSFTDFNGAETLHPSIEEESA